LYAQLARNPVLNASNASVVIETMRNIAEHILWGDKHDTTFFEYFLEKNILSFMLSLGAPPDVDAKVKIQLIQTLSMMIENMRTPSSLYFILSNNRINDLISHHDIDFAHDEDLLAHYISFLKTLALKLDSNTVQFFFNAREQRFPLLTEGAAYHDHRESMVQTAVRNLVLQVFSVNDVAMQRYLCERFVPVFSTSLAHALGELCVRYATVLAAATDVNRSRRKTLTPTVQRDQIDDELLFMNDALRSMSTPLARLWARALLHHWVAPQLLRCTAVAPPRFKTDESDDNADDNDDADDSSGDDDDNNDDGDDDDNDDDDDDDDNDAKNNVNNTRVEATAPVADDVLNKGVVSIAVAWSLLARLLVHLSYEPLTTILGRRLTPQCDNAALVRRCIASCADEKARGVPLRTQFGAAPRRRTRNSGNATEEARAAQTTAVEPLPEVAIDEAVDRDCSTTDATPHADFLLQTLTEGDDAHMLACLCVLIAVVDNKSLDSVLVSTVLCESRVAAVAALLHEDDRRRAVDVRRAAGALLQKCGKRLHDSEAPLPPPRLPPAQDSVLSEAFARVSERVRGHLASPWREVVEPVFLAATKRAQPSFSVLDCVDQMAVGTAGLVVPIGAPPALPERPGELSPLPPLPPLRWAAMSRDFEQLAALMVVLDKKTIESEEAARESAE
jgi:hypothetical protein